MTNAKLNRNQHALLQHLESCGEPLVVLGRARAESIQKLHRLGLVKVVDAVAVLVMDQVEHRDLWELTEEGREVCAGGLQ